MKICRRERSDTLHLPPTEYPRQRPKWARSVGEVLMCEMIVNGLFPWEGPGFCFLPVNPALVESLSDFGSDGEGFTLCGRALNILGPTYNMDLLKMLLWWCGMMSVSLFLVEYG
ncbi:hypothetical protein J6590_059317 [Homalodisca vitripennis]|nr:hypothetical protein J6590_059317 [Homalodisca vitripennis]